MLQRSRPRTPQRRSFVARLAIALVSSGLGGFLNGCAALDERSQDLWQAFFQDQIDSPSESAPPPTITPVEPAQLAGLTTTQFLSFGGGGAPSYNEIALEKNLLYFQRTLKALGHSPEDAALFFANGLSGEATIRYLDNQGDEQFKAPEIPHLRGPATADHLRAVFERLAQATQTPYPLFFYFTGHGSHNERNENNNAMILWGEDEVDVREFGGLLDQLPPQRPVVTMMAQCYSGSFANLIYEGGNAARPVAIHNRCGFFATVKELPSVGCTPEVDEADYRDYSSSFFAGLTGIDRVGRKVTSADYNRDRRISYAEAHAFAKIDEITSDRPVSSLEVWLQTQLPKAQTRQLLSQTSIFELYQQARPERAAVIQALSKRLQFSATHSFLRNANQARSVSADAEAELMETYRDRLRMELLSVAAETWIQTGSNLEQKQLLQKLLDCENQTPPPASTPAQS